MNIFTNKVDAYGLQRGFQLRAMKRKCQSAMKRPRYYVSRSQSQCAMQVSGNSLQRSISSSTSGWISRVTDGATGILIHRLVKQTQFFLTLIALWSETETFKHRKPVSF